MPNAKLLVALSIGLIAAACSSPYDQGRVSAPAQAFPASDAPPPSPAPYVGPRTTGVETSRDEYGFRYDAQGNRIDRHGRLISPQSTTP